MRTLKAHFKYMHLRHLKFSPKSHGLVKASLIIRKINGGLQAVT